MGNRVLILADYYLPGFKAGGLVRSLSNMIHRLGKEYEFIVLTNDHDIGDHRPYSTIDTRVPQTMGGAKIHYLSHRQRRFFSLLKLIRSYPVELIYLNSAFSFYYSIQVLIARRLGWLKSAKLVVAPRGEFSNGALKLKSFKKRSFLLFAKLFGLYRDVNWQASSFVEEADIRRIMDQQISVTVASDIPTAPSASIGRTASKQPGTLNIVFLARITRIKNLAFALESLQDLQGKVSFHIYGPIEDYDYWQRCQFLIEMIADRIDVAYKGIIRQSEIQSVLSQYDLFYLPTLGENFGHVIFEALSAGCPILLSDNTQWFNLQEEGLGWSLSLDNLDAFKRVLQECVDMDDDAHQAYVNRAINFAKTYSSDPYILESNRVLLNTENEVRVNV